jgi:hypothetical protein
MEEERRRKRARMPPMVIYPQLYVLELEEGKYYVGVTYEFGRRLNQHMAGDGALWTARYKVRRVERVELIIDQDPHEVEKDVTLQLMRIHGYQNVRGGPWCQVEMKSEPRIFSTVIEIKDE